eukprot:403339651
MVDKNQLNSQPCQNVSEYSNILSLFSTPTNNFGLGLLFKKIVILNEQHQRVTVEEISKQLEEELKKCIANNDQKVPNIPQDNSLCQISPNDDQISTFFEKAECPQILNIPVAVETDKETGEKMIIRKSHDFDLTSVYDDYDKSYVDLQDLLHRVFLTQGRLFHHERILCWFPRYLQYFEDTHAQMMNKQDVLPITWKYYLSIMAVSCYDCEYLLKIQEEQFLLWGGDINWLTQGLKAVEKKLERISELNEMLAFRPWTISMRHIERLARSSDNNIKLNWSIHEILQAGAILSYYHSLCCFAFGNGIKEDLDSAMSFDKVCQNQQGKEEVNKLELEKTLNFMKSKKFEEDEKDYKQSHNEEDKNHNDEDFDDFDSDSIENKSHTSTSNQSTKLGSVQELDEEHLSEDQLKKKEVFGKHRKFKVKEYIQFLKTKESLLDLSDYSWEFQGQDLYSRYLPELTEVIQNQIDYALKMTKNSYGQKDQDVDTRYFRQSLSIYIMQVYGIKDDQFQYENINKILIIPQKQYIRQIGCFPSKVTQKEYEDMSSRLTAAEKCHISIIVAETKKQVELIYLSRAVNQFINQ